MLVYLTLKQPSLNLSMAAWRALKSFFVDGLAKSDTLFIYSILYDFCKSLTHSHLYMYVPYCHLCDIYHITFAFVYDLAVISGGEGDGARVTGEKVAKQVTTA